MSHLAINEPSSIQQIIPLAQLVNLLTEIPSFGPARFKSHMHELGLKFDHVKELIDVSLVFNGKGEPTVEVEIYLDSTNTGTGIVGLTYDEKAQLHYADLEGLLIPTNNATV